MPETAHIIQPIIAPNFGRPATLYVNDPEGAPGFMGPAPWSLALGEGLRGDTYINAFYPAVWRAQTGIGRLGLTVRTTGTLRVQLLAIVGHNRQVSLLSEEVTGDTTLWLEDLPKHAGRIFLRLAALEATTLHALDWVTDVAPLQEPRLSVGICTFNREEQLAVTLDALASHIPDEPAIEQVFVVNQSKSFTAPSILALGETDKFSLLEQPNLGGCGGFTRTMVETLAVGTATHHLVMDDDIVIDPRMLTRVVRFLAWAKGEFAVGGQMLQIENPTRMHEAGGKLSPLWYVDSIGKNLDMSMGADMALFNKPLDIDYNAWWFCVIPTDAIRRLGLPSPLFIRGDDIEFGCRMATNGVHTVALPGLAVWHESFAHKTSDWLQYYDFRNRLYLTMLYPKLAGSPDALYMLGFFMYVLYQHRYRGLDMILHAMGDFLGDPAVALGPDSATRHARLMARTSNMPAPKTIARDDLPEAEEGIIVALDPAVIAMVSLSVNSGVALHLSRLLPRKKPLRFTMMPTANSVRSRDYLVPQDPDGQNFRLFSVNLGAYWKGLVRSLAMAARFAFTVKTARKRGRAYLADARTEEKWRAQFNRPRG